MAKQNAILAVQQIAPAGAGTPRVRTTCGVGLHDADGTIEFGSRRFASDNLFWGYEVEDAIVFNVGDSLTFLTKGGHVHGRCFVLNKGWHDSTRAVTAAIASFQTAPSRCRLCEFVTNLCHLHERVEWIDVTDIPYPFLELDTTGSVTVLGLTMQVGDLPVSLPNSWTVSCPGYSQVHIADAEGVFDRFRYVTGKWQRLVKRRQVPWTALESGLIGNAGGELIFTAPGVPPLVIGAGNEFTMHLADDKSLMRLSPKGSIFTVSAREPQIAEYVYEGYRLWQQEGARDQWSYELLGVPGHDGEKPVLSKEIVPGATVYASGKFEAINRTYLLGEEINLQCGGVSIRRAVGYGEPVFISANGSTVGYLYSLCGDWFKMSPVSPDQKFFTWRRCLNQQNVVDAWIRYVDSIIGDTPGVHGAVVIWAAVWRFVKAAGDEPCLAPFEIVILALGLCLYITRAALLIVTVPINLAWRSARQVRRAFELTK